jgi:glutaredoxin 3
MTAVEELLKKQAQKHKEEADVLTEAQSGVEDSVALSQIQEGVKAMIESNSIVVFSKSYCPFCRQAKMALRSIPDLEFAVIEMDDGQHDGWQAQVAQLAESKAIPEAANNKKMAVPQIFINQKYVGGAEDLADMFVDQRLATMLGRSLS